jgi:hypothetical protein
MTNGLTLALIGLIIVIACAIVAVVSFPRQSRSKPYCDNQDGNALGG